MKMNRLKVMVLGLAMACAGMAHAQVDPDVQKLAERWTQAYNNHDKEALAAVYTEDARVMLHGEPTLSGRPHRRVLGQGFQGRQSTHCPQGHAFHPGCGHDPRAW